MTRKALIISNPGTWGQENYCDGVKEDVMNYRNFLKSPQGGGWFENEIVCLIQPSLVELNMHINIMSNIEYTMIIFCGHGYFFNNEMVIEINNNHSIYAYGLKAGANKRSIILDCCRTKADIIGDDVISELKVKITNCEMNWIEARMYYDSLISMCSKGCIMAFSCNLDENAKEHARIGGFYSSSLIGAAQKWAEVNNHKGSKGIIDMHNGATVQTQVISNNTQHPKIEITRNHLDFPFVVSTN